MAKVITFSRTFPAYHPRKGDPTYFVEKFWESIGLPGKEYCFNLPDEYQNLLRSDSKSVWPKFHTIRSGFRWGAGDKFSPRVWSGKPYQSKQIIIAPDIEIKKIWHFEKDPIGKNFILNGIEKSPDSLLEIAKNDGLELSDLLLWFKYPNPFSGQIICWNENISY